MNAASSTRGAFRLRAVVGLDQRLADAGQRGDVAAVLHLVVLRRDRVSRGVSSSNGILRVHEAFQAALAQRVERDHRHAALHRFLQRMQHPRRRGRDVLADVEDAVGVLEVLELDGADAGADALRQRDRRALVAHVRAVGQVVRAVQPREQLPQVGGLERGASRGVEHHLLRLHRAQLAPDLRERLRPLHGPR
jgi:hypothetical protein